MAEFKEVIKQRERMHEHFSKFDESMCHGCPIYIENNGRNINCTAFINKYPQEAEELIMKWASEHPIKTNADKFKEVFGLDVYEDLRFKRNACSCFYCKYHYSNTDCGKCEYRGVWEREYKEPKEVE